MGAPQEFHYRLAHRSSGWRPGAHPGTRLGAGQEFVSHMSLYARPDPRRLDLRASLRDLSGNWLVRVHRQRASVPVHAIVVDPDDSQRLYLGTDLGVMVSIDGGRTWMSEETGFGPAVTMWLQIVTVQDGPKYLFAFTHGRGAWRVRLP